MSDGLALRQCLERAGYVRLGVVDEPHYVRVDFDYPRRVPLNVINELCQRIDCAPRLGGNVCWDALHDAFDAVLLPATGRHRGLFQDGSFDVRIRDIARIKLACLRRIKMLNDLGVCIHFGSAICVKCDKRARLRGQQERAKAWLSVLLAKSKDVPYISGEASVYSTKSH